MKAAGRYNIIYRICKQNDLKFANLKRILTCLSIRMFDSLFQTSKFPLKSKLYRILLEFIICEINLVSCLRLDGPKTADYCFFYISLSVSWIKSAS